MDKRIKHQAGYVDYNILECTSGIFCPAQSICISSTFSRIIFPLVALVMMLFAATVVLAVIVPEAL